MPYPHTSVSFRAARISALPYQWFLWTFVLLRHSVSNLTKTGYPTKDLDEHLPDVNLADYGIPNWNLKTYILDVTLRDRDHAIKCPALGWPPYEELYNMRKVRNLTDYALSAAHMRHWEPGPISKALHAYGAPVVNASDSWMMNDNGTYCSPFV